MIPSAGFLFSFPLAPTLIPTAFAQSPSPFPPKRMLMGIPSFLISFRHALISSIRFHAYNIGLLSSRASSPLFTPCTPAAVIRLLESTGVPIPSANAVVLGRSDIVGNPVAALLRNLDATVTQCHSRTKNVEQLVSTCFPISDYFSPQSHSDTTSRYSRRRYRTSRIRQRLVDQTRCGCH